MTSLKSNWTTVPLLAALVCGMPLRALQPLDDGGTPRSDCSGVPGVTEVSTEGAFFWLPLPTGGPGFYRAVIEEAADF